MIDRLKGKAIKNGMQVYTKEAVPKVVQPFYFFDYTLKFSILTLQKQP